MEQKFKPLHLACSDDEMRPNMALIEIKNNHATATNGHIVVRIDLNETATLDPETLKILNGKYIHKEVWKEFWKCDGVEFDDANIYVYKNGIKKIFEYAVSQGQFFDIDSIILDVKSNGNEAKNYMRYSPTLINTIGKIFQEDNFNFSFTKGKLGTVVFPFDGCGMFAILVPAHSEADKNERYFFL